MEWQAEWGRRHVAWIQIKEDELRQRRDKEEAEKRAKAAELMGEKAQAKPAPKGPQPGKFVEWMMEQKELEREARIRSMIINKKQLDTKEMEKRRKPLQKLEAENELKKRKQKQSGTKWRHLRNKLSPAFTSAKLKSMCQLVADCGASVERYVEENIHRGSLDVKNMMRSYTTDVIASCIFGLECDSFKQPDSFKKFATGKVFTGTPFSNFRWLFLDNFPKLSRTLRIRLHSKETENFFNRMVEETVSYREKNNYTRNDLMQTLINMKNGD
ncbi:hypothetical protein NQ315_013505 [Exocentrus adspersus]|uniref:Cytochrome P450 n=1 Tax=Exocentrus adspersus TaxID=1586481 RepID=A0AAV8V6V2_9CUCU|nr:hypothetical protein NQ315_013505 [Exocentrus adspersus]